MIILDILLARSCFRQWRTTILRSMVLYSHVLGYVWGILSMIAAFRTADRARDATAFSPCPSSHHTYKHHPWYLPTAQPTPSANTQRETTNDGRRNPSSAPSLHYDIRVLPRRRRRHRRHRDDSLAQATPEQCDVAGSLDLHLVCTYYVLIPSHFRPVSSR
jgi:hypothetical protein